jgi:hypothetical protein
MNDSTQKFPPGEFGSSGQDAPGPDVIADAATRLGRDVYFINEDGYECDLIAATIDPATGAIAYVESRAKEFTRGGVDISISVHLRDAAGNEQSCDIESYNPYFGCTVYFFHWIGDAAVLIYNEKHNIYVCRVVGTSWPPQFIEIDYPWVIKDSVLAYTGYQEKQVRRLTFPQLEPMAPVSLTEAERDGYLPS